MKITKTVNKVEKTITVDELVFNLELTPEELCYLAVLGSLTGNCSKLRNILEKIHDNTYDLFTYFPTLNKSYAFYPPDNVYDEEVKLLMKNFK